MWWVFVGGRPQALVRTTRAGAWPWWPPGSVVNVDVDVESEDRQFGYVPTLGRWGCRPLFNRCPCGPRYRRPVRGDLRHPRSLVGGLRPLRLQMSRGGAGSAATTARASASPHTLEVRSTAISTKPVGRAAAGRGVGFSSTARAACSCAAVSTHQATESLLLLHNVSPCRRSSSCMMPHAVIDQGLGDRTGHLRCGHSANSEVRTSRANPSLFKKFARVPGCPSSTKENGPAAFNP